ncbi:uncharacterized protein LOC114961807 isoform X1 [Acropora millepora]|uniref:uncharacterized protein LOC114961807 isoform X1 n=1 Tax=Acropora millepora TaxID=45264 RepID=UPI001CF3A7C0|nr:uncharacterized protein LOC114961807 isoform X1 [Acropora millepora]
MNAFCAFTVLFLFIGGLKFVNVNCWKTKREDSQITLTVTPDLGNLYVGFNKTLTLNCSISQPTYGLLPEQVIWQHNNSWKPNVTYVLNNRTVQLRTNYVRDDDAGLYRCVVFYNASKFIHSREIRVLVAEKPSLKVGTLKIANVFGMPVQELYIKWTALEGNVIFKLFVGHMDMFYRCNLLEREVCTHVSRGKNEPFSCFVGKDKLHELFRWQELTPSISQCPGSHWCDRFCVKLKRLTRTCNAQACAPLDTYFYFWSLLIQVKCPSPVGVNATFEGDRMKVSWRPSPLVWSSYHNDVWYFIFYNRTDILTGNVFQSTKKPSYLGFRGLHYTLTDIRPFSKYGVSVGCKFAKWGSQSGPVVYKEFTSLQQVPSDSPKCEVVNNTMEGRAFVLVKAPPIHTWNGIPTKYVLHYEGDQENHTLDVPLPDVNKTDMGAWINYTNVHKTRSVRATICNGAGCRDSLGLPCFIEGMEYPAPTEKAYILPSKSQISGTEAFIIVFVAVALALSAVSCAVYFLQKQNRAKKKRQEDLMNQLNAMNLDPDNHLYETGSGFGSNEPNHYNKCEF